MVGFALVGRFQWLLKRIQVGGLNIKFQETTTMGY